MEATTFDMAKLKLLTTGERRIFDLYGRGLRRDEIAAIVNHKLSVKTVDNFARRIRRKLGLDNTTTMAVVACMARSQKSPN